MKNNNTNYNKRKNLLNSNAKIYMTNAKHTVKKKNNTHNKSNENKAIQNDR